MKSTRFQRILEGYPVTIEAAAEQVSVSVRQKLYYPVDSPDQVRKFIRNTIRSAK